MDSAARQATELTPLEVPLNGILDGIEDAVSLLDREWRYTYVNAQAELLSGLKREQLIGTVAWALHADRLGTEFQNDAQRAVSEQRQTSSEYFCAPLNRWYEHRFHPTPHGLLFFTTDITERRQAEATLRESEERLRLAQEAAAIGTWEWDLTTDEVVWSKEIYELLGVSQNTTRASFETWMEYIHPDDRDQVMARAKSAVEKGEKIEMDFRVVRRDGTIRWVLSRASISCDSSGRPMRLVGLNQDITQRLESEAAVRKSESRFRRIFETVGVSLWDQDFSALVHKLSELRAAGVQSLKEYLDRHPEFVQEAVGLVVVKDVNQATLRFLGAPDKKDVLASIQNILPPASLSTFRAELLAIWEGQARFDAETVVLTLNGEPRHVVLSIEFSADDPKLSSVLVSMMDITPLKQAEALVRASEERQRRAVEAGQVGLWEWDIRANTVSWSDYVYQLHGLEPGSFEGTVEGFASLISSADKERVSMALNKALAGDGHYHVEFRPARPDGQCRWLATSGKVTFDESGQPLMMYGAVLDMTDRRQAEEALRRTNAELEEFAFVASHDLQEPLRTVNIYTQLLLKRLGLERDQEAAQFAEFVRSGVLRMELLIQDLLSYSRVVHPEQEEARPADLNSSLQQALDALRIRIEETDAVITSDELPVVIGEETQLAQVLQNIISNALKYRKDGERPEVHLSSERKDGMWLVSIADKGIGFDPRHSERIFRLFTRLHRDSYPGTGLGLAICRRTIERYGGQIWAVSSGEGSGSTFHFTLPGEAE